MKAFKDVIIEICKEHCKNPEEVLKNLPKRVDPDSVMTPECEEILKNAVRGVLGLYDQAINEKLRNN